MGTEFQFCTMQIVLEADGGMVARQSLCVDTYCHWIVSLKMVRVANLNFRWCVFGTIFKNTKKKTEYLAEQLRYLWNLVSYQVSRSGLKGKGHCRLRWWGHMATLLVLLVKPQGHPSLEGSVLWKSSLGWQPCSGSNGPFCVSLPISASVLTRVPRETEPTGVLWYV